MTEYTPPPADEPRPPVGPSDNGAPHLPPPPDDGTTYADPLDAAVDSGEAHRMAATAPPTGSQVIAYGMTLRGTYGPPENVNRFTKDYYGDHTAASWCLIFVWFCLDHFGAAGLIGGKIAYVPNLKSRVGSKWHTSKASIAKGDPVAFDFNRSGEPEHIGFFVRWLDKAHTTFESLEGNTVSGGSDDAVATKTRRWSDVFGYVKPGLSPESPGTYPGTIYRYRKGDLMTGSHVRWIQQRATAHGFKLDDDGVFGTATRAAVEAFQTAAKLTADGEVGPKTWKALAA